MPDAAIRGKFVWHELLTTDLESASSFYSRVVGWTMQTSDWNQSYKLFVSGTPMAGLMILPDEAKAMGAPPHWLAYIGTPQVDATLREAVMLGGRVLVEPMDLPGIGRFAVLMDPQGAAFAIFTPEGEGGSSDHSTELGDFSWHELITTDWQAGFAFYQRLFGWEKTEAMDMGAMGTYQMFGLRGRTMGGMFNKPAEMPAPPHWLPYALVTDARRAADLVKSAGGRVVNGPMEVPGGDWIVQFQDQQGVIFAVHSRTPAAKPARPAPKPPAEKAAPKAPAKKAAKKAPAKKAPAKKAPAKKAPAKKAPAKKAKKAPAKKAKKAVKAPARRAAKKAARAPMKKMAKKGRKKAVMKTRKAPARKAAKKTTRKTTKKTRKTAPRARRTVRRTARRTARKAGRRR
jgi:predicted enzyme related to lactoylglutathione lyase